MMSATNPCSDIDRTIARSFNDLVESHHSTERVTVLAIAKKAEINRKTFYNHFDNVDTLIIWILRDGLRRMLERPCFRKSILVYPDPALHDPYPQWPFFVQTNIDEKFENTRMFMRYIGEHFQEHRTYYERIFASTCYLNLFDYIVRLFIPAIREDILLMLDGRTVSPDVLDFLTEYHTYGIFGRVNYRYTRTKQYMLQEDLEPFFRYSHLILQYTIDNLCANPSPNVSADRNAASSNLIVEEELQPGLFKRRRRNRFFTFTRA